MFDAHLVAVELGKPPYVLSSRAKPRDPASVAYSHWRLRGFSYVHRSNPFTSLWSHTRAWGPSTAGLLRIREAVPSAQDAWWL